MQPKSGSSRRELFGSQLREILHLAHPLCVLAGKIAWSQFEAVIDSCYAEDLTIPPDAARARLFEYIENILKLYPLTFQAKLLLSTVRSCWSHPINLTFYSFHRAHKSWASPWFRHNSDSFLLSGDMAFKLYIKQSLLTPLFKRDSSRKVPLSIFKKGC